jgi:hypothetical protein
MGPCSLAPFMKFIIDGRSSQRVPMQEACILSTPPFAPPHLLEGHPLLTGDLLFFSCSRSCSLHHKSRHRHEGQAGFKK